MGIALDQYKGKPAGDYPPFINASDVGKKLTVKITDAREGNFATGSRIVLDVDIGKGETRSFSLNKTNLGAIIELHGEDTDKWDNKKLTLITIPVRNPTTNKMVKGIRVQL